MTLIIGIIGTKGSGKDTLADFLVAMHPGAVKYSMATPIKRACKELFLLSDKQLSDPVRKEAPSNMWPDWTPRRMMQWLGTDVFRDQVDPHFWIKHAAHVIRSCQADIMIIPDIRFINEAEMIRSQPSHLLIRIVRDSTIKVDTHASETEMDSIPSEWISAKIFNNGTLEDLEATVDVLSKIHIRPDS